MAGPGPAGADRPAGRRDEGVGAGGAVVRAGPGAVSWGCAPTSSAIGEIHIHVPAGRRPQGRPLGGHHHRLVLVSLASGIPIRSDVAMTGELTLRGRVLPIGGLKEKLLAAVGAGMRLVDHPQRQRRRAVGDPRPRAGEGQDRAGAHHGRGAAPGAGPGAAQAGAARAAPTQVAQRESPQERGEGRDPTPAPPAAARPERDATNPALGLSAAAAPRRLGRRQARPRSSRCEGTTLPSAASMVLRRCGCSASSRVSSAFICLRWASLCEPHRLQGRMGKARAAA